MRIVYTILFSALIPFALFRLWRRGAKLPAYRQRWNERFGKTPPLIHSQKPVLWFHTVSVGEFIAARPLIQHYLDKSDYQIYISCTTPTGSERIQESFGERVSHSYLPYDIPIFLNRFIRAIRPSIFVCIETELWPNLMQACATHAIPVVLANARLSEKSARGYARFPSLTQNMLEAVKSAAIQNEQDAQRFIDLGLNEASAHSIGNIKFDLEINEQISTNATTLKNALIQADPSPIWIAASTHKSEDEIILASFSTLKKTHPSLKLILVPRHPERFSDVYSLCINQSFRTLKRSENHIEPFDILLGDTMGELLLLFGAADFAFIGGSLVNNGGHNYIEPAAWGLPLFSGPSTYNFRETAEELIKEKALIIADNDQELTQAINELLSDQSMFKAMGLNAKRVAEKNRGALKKLIHIIDDLKNN